MTPHQKYLAILTDIERLLQERAAHYFSTRYAGKESADLKVQCDTITVLLELYLKPHAAWFESYEVTHLITHIPAEGLTIDLDPAVLAEVPDAND